MKFPKYKQSTVIKIDTLIGKKAVIDGNISGKGSYKIDGTVDGNITVTGDLVMSNKAVVTGNITAKNIIIAGSVIGDIEASGQLTIKATGKISGQQKCGSLIVEEGSNVVGKCEISGNCEEDEKETEEIKETKKKKRLSKI